MNEETILRLLKESRYKKIIFVKKDYWSNYGMLFKKNLEASDIKEIASQLFEENAQMCEKEYDDVIVFFDKDLTNVAHTEVCTLFKTSENIAVVIEDYVIDYDCNSCRLEWFDKEASRIIFSHDWQYLVGELVRFDAQTFCDAYASRNN